MAQGELQNAVDAAAIGGAKTLGIEPENAEYHALEIAAGNDTDGWPVDNETAGTKVTAVATPPTTNDPGQMEVTATRQLQHMLAVLFDRFNDTITATAIAGTGGTVDDLYEGQAFPLIVSADTVPGIVNGNGVGNGRGNVGNTASFDPVPLYLKNIGDEVHLYINSQIFKNAAFTSFTMNPVNATYIKSAIDQYLGIEKYEAGTIPSVEKGDDIYMINGVAGQKHLAQDPRKDLLMARPYIVLPVISGNVPFNQTAEVIGFIAVKVTDVTINQSGGEVETITGTLVHGLVAGEHWTVSQTQNLLGNLLSVDHLAPNTIRLMPSSTEGDGSGSGGSG